MRYALMSIFILAALALAGCGGSGVTPDRSAWFEGTWEISVLAVAEDTGLSHTWSVGDRIWFTTQGIWDPGADDNTPSFGSVSEAPAEESGEVLLNTISGDSCLYHYKFVQDPLGQVNDVRWEIKAALKASSQSAMSGWLRAELQHGADPLDVDDVDVSLVKISDELVGTPLIFR